MIAFSFTQAAFAVCPVVDEVVLKVCVGFLLGGPGSTCWWVGSGSFPLVGRAVLRKTLRRLSADGGAVFHPVGWPEVSRHWGLQFFGWG